MQALFQFEDQELIHQENLDLVIPVALRCVSQTLELHDEKRFHKILDHTGVV